MFQKRTEGLLAVVAFGEKDHAGLTFAEADHVVLRTITVSFLEEGWAKACVGEQPPANTIGEAGFLRLSSRRLRQRERKLMQRRDLLHRCEHGAHGGGFQELAAEESGDEEGEIVSVGGHGACGARGESPCLCNELSCGVEAIGGVYTELFAVDEAGVVHVQWREDGLLHEFVERLLLLLLDDELHKVDAFSGVEKLRPGLVMEMQLLVGLKAGKVRKTGDVRQQHARCHEWPRRILHNLRGRSAVGLVRIQWPGKLLRNGEVEIELAALDQLHDIGGEDALGNRRGPGDGVAIHGRVRIASAQAVRDTPDGPAAIKNGDLCTGDVRVGECFAREALRLGRGEVRTVEAADVLCGCGQGECKAEGGKKAHGWILRCGTVGMRYVVVQDVLLCVRLGAGACPSKNWRNAAVTNLSSSEPDPSKSR